MSNGSDSIPDFVRMKALKGFRAHVDGKFIIVNPGDVVTIPKHEAIEVRTAGKAVMTTEQEKIQKDYLPERKRKASEESKKKEKEKAAS